MENVADSVPFISTFFGNIIGKVKRNQFLFVTFIINCNTFIKKICGGFLDWL